MNIPPSFQDFNYKDDAQLKEELLKKNEKAILYVFWGDYNPLTKKGGFRSLLCKNAKLTGHREDSVNDLIQSFYIYLYEADCHRLKKYDSSIPFAVWLSVVSYRFFKNFEKTYHKKIELVGDYTISYKEYSESTTDTLSDLEKIFDKLKPPKNEIMKAFIIYGYTPAEIAKKHNKSIDWVYLTKSRVMKELMGQLKNLLDYTNNR